MGLIEELNSVGKAINQDYEDSVITHYTPVFNSLMEKAKKHMEENSLPKIDLSIHSGLSYTHNGFKEDAGDMVEDLLRLGRLFQSQADYIAGCADSRSHRTPSLDEALRTAAMCFRDKIIKSISDTI